MAAKPTRSDLQDATRKAQCEWLESLKAKTGWSMTEISRRAGLHPGTLNRFLNDDERGSTLHAQTITAVAAATGVNPPGGMPISGSPAAPRGLREPEAAPYIVQEGSRMAALVAAIVGSATHLVPWEITSNALELEHILAGDVVILDMNAEARTGDVVCAQIYDWANPANTQTVWRVFEAPFLLSASPEKGQRKPRLVDGENVAIKGVVREILRPAR